MSSFKKAFKLGKTSTVPSESTSPSKGTPSIGGVSSLPARGVKPWLNGQRLVSSGHRQLDELIGGGIILGTTLLMETDLFSSLGDTFLAYNLVEALSNDQDVLILAEGALTVQSCLDSLPFNLTLSDELITVASQSAESGLKTKDNLSIAWQYEKYIDKEKESRVKSSRDSFCCSYDLSRRAQTALLNSTRIHRLTFNEDSALPSDKSNGLSVSHQSSDLAYLGDSLSAILDSFYLRVEKCVRGIIEQGHGRALRIYLPQLLSLYEQFDLRSSSACRSLARFILRLRYLARDNGACLMMTMLPTSFPTHLRNLISALVDTSFSIESFAGVMDAIPHEFKDLHGLLSVRRVQAVGVLAPFRPLEQRYGLKRDRRKLQIAPLHLPPEESRAFVGEPTKENNLKGSEKSVALEAGSACGSSASHKSKSIDF